MFSKLKKQKSKTPIDEMEQFYLNQFLNNTKNPPQGHNGMSPLGPSVNQMMGPNTSAGPQFQGRNGAMPSIGGLNPMMNNNFNPAQMPMVNHNMNTNPPSMMNQPYPAMNQNPNFNPSMNNYPNPNYGPMTDFNFPQPQPMNNANTPYPMMNNNSNYNQAPMMNNGGNPYPNALGNQSFNPNAMAPYPSSMPSNNYPQNQIPTYGPNSSSYPMTTDHYHSSQYPSLINENLSGSIGEEPASNELFPGQFSFNDFSRITQPQDALPNLTPSFNDLATTHALSNQDLRPNPTNPYSAGSDVQKNIQQNTSSTPYNLPSLTPTNTVGTTNPSIPTYSVDPALSSGASLVPSPQGYNINPTNSPANYPMINDNANDPVDMKNKVDNINIRLRKVESYLGFRPETTI